MNRQFNADQADQTYVGDISYIWTREGWLYLAVIIDLFSRAVVGWSMSTRLHAQLAIDALQMAIDHRRPASGLVMHTDRGSQYVATNYLQLLHTHEMIASMSAKGCCWDNAVAESFFHSLKTECVYLQEFETREQACDSVFDYIEVFYNRRRRHSSADYLAPLAYEQQHYKKNQQAVGDGPQPVSTSGGGLSTDRLALH